MRGPHQGGTERTVRRPREHRVLFSRIVGCGSVLRIGPDAPFPCPDAKGTLLRMVPSHRSGLRPTDQRPAVLPGTFPFSSFRRLRFGERPSCPRCDADRVHRWGSFSGRKRYRCVACRRTFSDFTGTPLAYIKKLPAWSPYCLCMREGLSSTPRRAAPRGIAHPGVVESGIGATLRQSGYSSHATTLRGLRRRSSACVAPIPTTSLRRWGTD